MAEFLYGCDNKNHPRVTVIHGMLDNPIMECEICHAHLHRIPQSFLFGACPQQLIIETCERNISRKRRGEARDYRYDSITTDRGLPGKDLHTRK